MKGKVKAIEGVYPITTLDAVKVCDGSNKSLKDMIDSGEIGGDIVTTSANFITGAYFLVDDLIFTKDNVTGDITISLNKKLTLNRIIVVTYSNGGYSQVSFTDGTIVPNGKSLIWNNSSGFSVVDYGAIKIQYDTVLIATNYGGRITGGIARHIWEKYNKYTHYATFGRTYNICMDEIPKQTNRTLHSMVVCEDELITLECNNGVDFRGDCHVYSLPDLVWKSTFKTNLIGKRQDDRFDGKINLRMVTADYNPDNECLMLGSGTADGSDDENLEGYIFYDFKNWKNRTDEEITFENTPHTILDFHTEGLFVGQTTAKLVWAELPDTVYFTTSNLKYVHKLLLGVGTNKLPNGAYNYDSSKRYNGTYKILKTYQQETPEVGNKDIQYHNGALYYTVKYISGGFRTYKSTLTVEGKIESDLLLYEPVDSNGNHAITGSPEGIVVWNGKIIAAHATYGKFYVHDVV